MRKLLFPAIAALAVAVSTAVSAAGFNYHGALQDGGKPADGSYDLQLTLYSASQGGQVVGGPLVVYKVPVRNGAFNTDVDFGAVQNASGGSWLAVQVRKSGDAAFAALDTRAAVSVNDTVATGSVCPGAWTIAGNAGNPAGSYLGTADNKPLYFEVNGTTIGQLFTSEDANVPDAPNVVFGGNNNDVESSAGATIAGGGRPVAYCGANGTRPCWNYIYGNYGTIGGGRGNQVNAYAGTIPGGGDNSANNNYATIGGGSQNTANGIDTTIAGGQSNTTGGQYDAIGGGLGNKADGNSATVSGGGDNYAHGDWSTVAGGAVGQALGLDSFVAGGSHNTASGQASIAMGSSTTASGDFSTAMGENASTNGHRNSFVYGDGSGTIANDADHQFLVQASGGAKILGFLTVNGNQTLAYASQWAYFGYTPGIAPGQASGTVAIGEINNGSPFELDCVICANGTIFGAQFLASSDARIKNILGKSDTARDLDLLNAIEVTNYTMKDKAKYGDRPFKKVIAQQVEKVDPQLVSKQTGFIPNVYKVASHIEAVDGGYRLRFDAPHGIARTAKKLELLPDGSNAFVEANILAVPSDREVIVKAEGWHAKRIFVYGEQVDDFRAVDYEGLSALNVSATQELSKRLGATQAQLDDLRARLDRLESAQEK